MSDNTEGSILTDISTIIDETNNLISSVRTSLETLNEKCILYIDAVDDYYYKSARDSEIIKNKMIEKINQAVNDDI